MGLNRNAPAASSAFSTRGSSCSSTVRNRGMKKCSSRNWFTPRRSQASHASDGAGRLGRVTFEQRDVVAVLGQQHRGRQSRLLPRR